MQLPDVGDVVELVRLDLLAGLAGIDGDGRPIAVDEPFPGRGQPTFVPRTDSDDPSSAFSGAELTPSDAEVGVVEWTYTCTHGGDLPGIVQTNKDVVIQGVTIVDRRDPDQPFRRYVDWSRVMAQLGVSASFRPEVDRLENLPSYNDDQNPDG